MFAGGKTQGAARRSGALSVIGADVGISDDVSYETLAIDAGAQVDGQMTHRGQTAAVPEPPLRLTDASDADG